MATVDGYRCLVIKNRIPGSDLQVKIIVLTSLQARIELQGTQDFATIDHCSMHTDIISPEQVFEYHSTEDRQYITGLIHAEKLIQSNWYRDPSVSIILLPEGIVEKESIVARSLKKVSLQLAGIN